MIFFCPHRYVGNFCSQKIYISYFFELHKLCNDCFLFIQLVVLRIYLTPLLHHLINFIMAIKSFLLCVALNVEEISASFILFFLFLDNKKKFTSTIKQEKMLKIMLLKTLLQESSLIPLSITRRFLKYPCAQNTENLKRCRQDSHLPKHSSSIR